MDPVKHPDVLGGAVKTGFDILESLLDARRKSEQHTLEMMRSTLGALPGVGVGLSLAETASRQHRELERRIVSQVKQAFSRSSELSKATSVGGKGRSTSDAAPPPDSTQNGRRRTGLRLTIPVGPSTVRVPIQLRNHRDQSDFVTLSANTPTAAAPAVVPLPIDLIRFEPQTLEIPARSTATANVILLMTPDLEVNRQYGTEIVISGALVKEIPLILQLVQPAPSPVVATALREHAS